jgi:hypothetical protein
LKYLSITMVSLPFKPKPKIEYATGPGMTKAQKEAIAQKNRDIGSYNRRVQSGQIITDTVPTPQPTPQPTPTPKPEQPIQLGKGAGSQLTNQQRILLSEVAQRDTGIRTITPQERQGMTGRFPAFTRTADLRNEGEFEAESNIISQTPSTTTRPGKFTGQATRGTVETERASIIEAQDMFSSQRDEVLTPLNNMFRSYQQKIDMGGDFEQLSKDFEREQKSIISGFEERQAFRYGLDINPRSVAQRRARDDFKSLQFSDRVRLNLLSMGESTQKGIIGISEYPREIFKGTLTSYKEVNGKVVKQKPLDFGKIEGVEYLKSKPTTPTLSRPLREPLAYLKEVTTKPETIGKGIAQAPFIFAGGLGIKNIIKETRKGKPLSQTIGQSVADLSPFKMQEGIYVAKGSPTIASFRTTQKGITQRTFIGKADGITIKGFETSMKGLQSGFISSKRAFVQVKAGGGVVKSGDITQIQPYTTGKTRIGKGFLGDELRGITGKGGVTKMTLLPRKTFVKFSTGEMKTILTPSTKQINVGSFTQTTKEGIRFTGGKYNPRLSYKQIVKSPDVKGMEFGLSPKSFKSFVSSGKMPKTKQLTQQQLKQVLVFPTIPKPPVVRPITTPSRIIPSLTPRQKTISSSIYAGTNQYELTMTQSPQRLKQGLISRGGQKDLFKSFMTSATIQAQSPLSRQRSISVQRSISEIAQKPRQQQIPRTLQATRQQQRTQQRSLLRNIFVQPRATPRMTFPRITTRGLGGGGLFGFGFGSQRARARTPTFKPVAVFGRRFGKFKLVGIGRSEKEAFGIGKRWATQTLGVTFKIPKASARSITGFKTKQTKDGIVYIEPRGRRLQRGTRELPEIQFFRTAKKKRRR